jgi:hypothetical protein
VDKVADGTPREGTALCKSCTYAVFLKGFNFQEHIHCGYAGKAVLFRVMQCSQYRNAAAPELTEMKKIAWVIESRNRGPWGFKGEKQTEIVVRPPGMPDETVAPE